MDVPKIEDADLLNRNGPSRRIRLLRCPDLLSPDDRNQVILFYASGPITTGSRDKLSEAKPLQTDFGAVDRLFYAIHSATSQPEVFQILARQSRPLLPHYIGTGLYAPCSGRWTWNCSAPDLIQIKAGLQQFDVDQILASLQLGQRVRLQTKTTDEPLLAKAEGHSSITLLPVAPQAAPAAEFDVLLVPISQDAVLGTLLLSPYGTSGLGLAAPGQEWPIPAAELERATAIAKHAALAIARLQQREAVQTPDQNLAQWVQNQVVHLQQALNVEAAVKGIIEKIRNSLDEAYIFETVMRELSQALVLDACSVGFYDEEQQDVDVRYTYTTTSDVCRLQQSLSPMAVYSEIYGLLRQGSCIQVSSLGERPEGRMVAYSTTVACPIMMEGRAIGDLWLHRPKHALFNAQEQDLIRQVTQQCAVGLRQARLYQQAKAQVRSLKTVGSLKDDFLSTVSHELRTPVTNIKMTAKMLELALSGQTITDKRIARYMSILHAEAQREIDLINDLLDLQRLDAGMQTLDLKLIEVTWLAQLLESFRERANVNGQELCVEIVTQTSHIVSDEGILKRIVAELLNNACKYTPPDEQISVRGKINDTGLYLRICNSGIEISPTEQVRIFQKFYRIRESDRRNRGGTGLGLALVKQLVQHLGGEIQLTSENRLTCFTLILPALQLPAPEPTD